MDYSEDPVKIDGVKKGVPLIAKRGAEIRLDMVPSGGPQAGLGCPQVVTRFHVANAEEFDPGMLVLGGPSLRKMGHQPKDDAHVFSRLRVSLPPLDEGIPAGVTEKIYVMRTTDEIFEMFTQPEQPPTQQQAAGHYKLFAGEEASLGLYDEELIKVEKVWNPAVGGSEPEDGLGTSWVVAESEGAYSLADLEVTWLGPAALVGGPVEDPRDLDCVCMVMRGEECDLQRGELLGEPRQRDDVEKVFYAGLDASRLRFGYEEVTNPTDMGGEESEPRRPSAKEVGESIHTLVQDSDVVAECRRLVPEEEYYERMLAAWKE